MEATALLKKDAMTETYNDVQNLINKTVWDFCKMYGGDFEEWKAEANLTFVQTYNNHKENKGRFSTWLCFCIWNNLLDYTRTLYKQSPKITKNKDTTITLESLEDKKKYSFSSLELLDGLQEDTKTLIFLIWNPPKGLKDIKIKNGKHPCHVQIVLKNYLSKSGWTGRRIRESFEEITRILNDN